MIMQSKHSRPSRWSILPAASIAREPQPLAQALQVVHSCLRLSPKKRNVDGMASAAPRGQRYLQNGRSMNAAATNNTTQYSENGPERFHTPTRKVVLNGSTSAHSLAL